MHRTTTYSWLSLKALLSVCALLMLLTVSKPVLANVSSVVVDADTGLVVQAKNADIERQPASLTKMMTAYMLFDAIEKGNVTLRQKLPVSARAERQPASRLGLRKGSKISVEEAILALVTKSANDVATVIAEALGGSEEGFAKMSSHVAFELGMNNTVFRNSSGLYHSKQKTTARDMAILGMALMRHFPQYYSVFSTKKFVFNGKTYKTHNNLLNAYHGIDGIKTGYIAASGYNLVASVKKDEKRLIGVVMGGKSSKTRDKMMTSLLEKSFGKLNIVWNTPPIPKHKPKMVFAKIKFPIPERKPLEKTIVMALSNTMEIKGTGDWAIQVGAFTNYLTAKKIAADASNFLGAYLGQKNIQILPQDFGERIGVVYKSKVLGMNKKQAQKACLVLKRNEKPCIILPPENLNAGLQLSLNML